jgi:hypothetical protein
MSLCSYAVCVLRLIFVLWDLSQAMIEPVVVVLLVLTHYNIQSHRMRLTVYHYHYHFISPAVPFCHMGY